MVQVQVRVKVKMGVEKVTTVGKHTGDITTILVDKGYIYTGGADGLIKVRNRNSRRERIEMICAIIPFGNRYGTRI